MQWKTKQLQLRTRNNPLNKTTIKINQHRRTNQKKKRSKSPNCHSKKNARLNSPRLTSDARSDSLKVMRKLHTIVVSAWMSGMRLFQIRMPKWPNVWANEKSVLKWRENGKRSKRIWHQRKLQRWRNRSQNGNVVHSLSNLTMKRKKHRNSEVFSVKSREKSAKRLIRHKLHKISTNPKNSSKSRKCDRKLTSSSMI